MADDDNDLEEATAGSDGDEPPASAGEIEKLRAELDEARAKAREQYDTMLRTVADFDNYRKRIARDQIRDREQAEEKVLKKLLPVIDNFERGLEHMRTSATVDAIKQGVEATYQQLLSVLREFGVEQMKALNTPFDPKLHDALTQVPDAAVPENTVITVAEAGYLIKDRVLRHAKVVVSRAP